MTTARWTDLSPRTVGGTLARAADIFGTSEALVYDGRRATYAELLEEAAGRAAGLIGLGVRAGDHIGVLMPNCWDSVLLFYAANLIGARAVQGPGPGTRWGRQACPCSHLGRARCQPDRRAQPDR